MRTLAFPIAPLVLAFAVAGCGGKQTAPPPGARQARMQQRAGAQRRAGPGAAPAQAGAFTITTAAFTNNAQIPKQYTADGRSISPPLQWTAPPAAAKSLALIVSDPDAPGRTYIHWVLYKIPAAPGSLPADVPKTDTIEGGMVQGKNSAGSVGWTPPAPPPGKLHHYHFRLYALDAPIDLAPGATAAELEEAMQSHTLITTEVTGTYER